MIILALLLIAADRTEEKLADCVAKANRAATHANQHAQEAGLKLNAHCQTRGQIAGIRPGDGLWGCVNQPAPPVPPPAPKTETENPKKEELNPKVDPAKPKEK